MSFDQGEGWSGPGAGQPEEESPIARKLREATEQHVRSLDDQQRADEENHPSAVTPIDDLREDFFQDSQE